MATIFTPRRLTPILPHDAVLGEPYDLDHLGLCQACRSAVIEHSSPEDIEAKTQTCWGTVAGINKWTSCGLCSLIARSIVELCPPYARKRLENPAERIRLTIFRAGDDDAEIGISSERHYIAKIKEVPSAESRPDGDVSWSNVRCSCCSLPRRLCSKSPDIDFEQVRGWLRECESHGERATDGNLSEDAYPLMLLDVRSKKLVYTKDTTRRYCALSYVYGSQVIFQTTQGTLGQLVTPGIFDDPEFHLSPTIKDALAIVEAIGEKYLWVDSLCIVHDDNIQHQHAIKTMGDIYRNSVLTIAVTSASSATDHIPGVLAGTRKPFPVTALAGKLIYGQPVGLHLALLGSTYESRGWTYQERLLSKRVLYVSKTNLDFFCMGCRGHSENERPTGFASVINPLHQLFKEGPRTYEMKRSWMDEYEHRSEWSNYFELVRKYSQKRLTYSSDALDAITGILETLAPFYKTEFYAGLPVSALLAALHWIPGYAEDTSVEDLPERRDGFPSWSWVGHSGAVEWLEDVILTAYWQWDGAAAVKPGIEIKSTQSDVLSTLHCHSLVAPVRGFRAELCPEDKTVPGRLMDPGDGLRLPLVKMYDSLGRWCGRLCYRSSEILTAHDAEGLEFMLLSKSATRPVLMECNSEPRWQPKQVFDTEMFTVTKEEDKLANICTIMLIKRVGKGFAERQALCQIHHDVWETLEKTEQSVILI